MKYGRIIFTDHFRDITRDDLLVYVDAGARGGLEGLWARVGADRMRVLAFEPDASETSAAAEGTSKHIVPKALWRDAGSVDLHLAKDRSSSSVHPPNMPLLARFDRMYELPRITTDVEQVKCATLDSVLSELNWAADFVKIDTQGAEYEIIEGAAEALKRSVFGVVVETWTVEVHRGQRLTGAILELMHERGFELFNFGLAAAWHRRKKNAAGHLGNRQVVGLDLLFFKDPSEIQPHLASPAAAVKAAAIADLYGFPDLAIEILDICASFDQNSAFFSQLAGLRQMIIASYGQLSRPWWVKRIGRALTGGNPYNEVAKLHY